MKQEINGVPFEFRKVDNHLELYINGDLVFVGMIGATRNFINDLNIMATKAWHETD